MAATRYTRSTDGSDADNGTTWALAKATLVGVAAIDTTGDTLWVSQVHAESSAATQTINFAGTAALPTKLLCGNDANQPPTALATTATVSTTGTSNINLNQGVIYAYGISFIAGVGASTTANVINSVNQCRFENCSFQLASTGASSIIQFSSSEFINCTYSFSAAGQSISLASNGNRITFRGGSFLGGTTSPTAVFNNTTAGLYIVEGLDFSNLSSGVAIATGNSANYSLILRNCKMPSGWTGTMHTTTVPATSCIEMFNCDSGDTHYRYRKARSEGTIQDESTIVRSGGSTDGITPWSWKMASTANVSYPMVGIDTPELVTYVSSVGSPLTATIHFVHDSVTALKDNEIWIEATYMGTSGVPLCTFLSEQVSVVGTAASLAASTETWTTTGLTNPNKQKMNLTFTPQEIGFLHIRVKLAKASYTVYVDPLMAVA